MPQTEVATVAQVQLLQSAEHQQLMLAAAVEADTFKQVERLAQVVAGLVLHLTLLCVWAEMEPPTLVAVVAPHMMQLVVQVAQAL
jgi:hypothetical protein